MALTAARIHGDELYVTREQYTKMQEIALAISAEHASVRIMEYLGFKRHEYIHAAKHGYRVIVVEPNENW